MHSLIFTSNDSKLAQFEILLNALHHASGVMKGLQAIESSKLVKLGIWLVRSDKLSNVESDIKSWLSNKILREFSFEHPDKPWQSWLSPISLIEVLWFKSILKAVS